MFLTMGFYQIAKANTDISKDNKYTAKYLYQIMIAGLKFSFSG